MDLILNTHFGVKGRLKSTIQV